MRVRENNIMRMVRATLAVLQEYSEAWKNHVAFTGGVEELNKLLGHVDEVMQQQAARAGAVLTKAEAKTLLGEIVQEVGGAVVACADTMGDAELLKRASYPPSKIASDPAPAVHSRCKDILVAATKMQVELKDYGVSPEQLEMLEKRLTAYTVAQPKPRQRQAEGKAASDDVVGDVKKMSRLLRFRLDMLIAQMRKANPHFVTTYRAARRIVHRPGTLEANTSVPGETSNGTPPPAPTLRPEVPHTA